MMEKRKFWAVMESILFNKIIEQTVVQSSIILNKDAEIIGMNKAFIEMFEINRDVNFIGMTWKNICPFDSEWRVFNNIIEQSIKTGGSYIGLGYSNKKKSWMIGKVYANSDKTRFSLYIGEVKDTLENYKMLKNYDNLTMLPKKDVYEKSFKFDLDNENSLNSLILIDLKKFHVINEKFGSKTGDEVLVEVVSRIQNLTAFEYPLYRVGGNQFLLVTPKNIEKEIVNKISEILSQTISINNNSFYVNAHIAIYNAQSEDDNQKAIYYVEEALWHAKKSSLPIYYYKKNISQHDLLFVEHDLRNAIDVNPEQFFIEYQMQYSIENNKYCGAEALIRWNHPEKGRVNPVDFLNIAQENHLLPKIDKIVFEKIIDDIKFFKDNGKDFPISMNLSAQSIMNIEFQNYIKQKLDELSPNINFEITETDKINPNYSQSFLEDLKNKGYLISIDDFGTGYASFEYIMNYPADCIKIDKTFIQNLEDNKKNQTIVSNIIKMSKGLNLKVVAEGVEKESEVNILKKLGCNIIQGYYYARPHTPEKILAGAILF